MNGTSQTAKDPNFEKVFPGCLGRMVNLFELNIGVSPNRLLTDKPHRDGSPVSRSRSDVSRMSPSFGQVEKQVVVSQSRSTSSNRKSNGTPMKKLIAQEMSKEFNSRSSPPNLVAKLMGLDTLSQQELEQPTTERGHFRGHHHRSHSETTMSNWNQEDRFFQYRDPSKYRDIYEVCEQPQKVTHNDKRMSLVCQKFVEAKRLSMDGSLRQSKQFQDALDVLSSNKDLFIKCLEEPNSLFSRKLCNLHSIPPPLDSKRITVLRPSKMVDNYNLSEDGEGKKQIKKGDSENINLKSPAPESHKNPDSPTQPTRIVVLKPSLDKVLDDDNSVTSPQSQSTTIIHGEDLLEDMEDNKNCESREVAKAVMNQMREKLSAPHMDDDETVICSVLPNGYMADESSFNKSEIDYPAGNLSDLESTSPVSKHSWDYGNLISSPFSLSSFSRASYSPESSVGKEAKKRLSERWALMASNGSQEQRCLRRSSSTLGEMLALSEAKKETPPPNEGKVSKEGLLGEMLALSEAKETPAPNEQKVLKKELKDSVSEQRVDDENMDNSGSKSVLVSSFHFGTRLNAENTSVPVEGKLEIPDDTKSKSVKLSFRRKVSSLFFSRNKKSNKDKSIGSETSDEFRSDGTENPVEKVPYYMPSGMLELSNEASLSSVISMQDVISPEAVSSGNPGETQDQPSPVSVLGPPFELNEHAAKVYPRVQLDQYGSELSHNPIGSSLIDKSPPIGSIARTLSWDDSNTDKASSHPITKEQSTGQETSNEEQEWYFFTKTLLSVSGFEGEEVQCRRWHSSESPLDPSLREKYININGTKTSFEAKRRQRRSMQKLVFDCVNAALVQLEGYGETGCVLDEVWALMNGWFLGGCGEEAGLVAERVVREEVAGNGWVENMRTERGILGNEFEGDLVGELLEEAVVELTGRA